METKQTFALCRKGSSNSLQLINHKPTASELVMLAGMGLELARQGKPVEKTSRCLVQGDYYTRKVCNWFDSEWNIIGREALS